VVVTDHLSRILMLNAAAERLTGWTHAEAEGQPVLRVLGLVDVESGEPAEDPVPLAILKDGPIPLDRSRQLISRSGSQIMIEGSAAPVKAFGIALGTVAHVSRRQRAVVGGKATPAGAQCGRGGADGRARFRRILESAGDIRNQSELLLRQFGEYSPARQAIEIFRHRPPRRRRSHDV